VTVSFSRRTLLHVVSVYFLILCRNFIFIACNLLTYFSPYASFCFICENRHILSLIYHNLNLFWKFPIPNDICNSLLKFPWSTDSFCDVLDFPFDEILLSYKKSFQFFSKCLNKNSWPVRSQCDDKMLPNSEFHVVV
jgi:hypothetical protein